MKNSTRPSNENTACPICDNSLAPSLRWFMSQDRALAEASAVWRSVTTAGFVPPGWEFVTELAVVPAFQWEQAARGPKYL